MELMVSARCKRGNKRGLQQGWRPPDWGSVPRRRAKESSADDNAKMFGNTRFLIAIFAVATLLSGCSSAPPDVAAPPAHAERSSSGLAWIVLEKGTGSRHPRPNSEVTVHYTGWTTSGELFDSSVQRGQPARFGLDQVIKGWTEGVQMMVEGEKRRFWIPAELAYGNNPSDGRPAGILVFDIELIRIES
jgi:hypothetical protein